MSAMPTVDRPLVRVLREWYLKSPGTGQRPKEIQVRVEPFGGYRVQMRSWSYKFDTQ